MIRRGVSKFVSKEQNSSWHRELTKDLALGLGYTVLIVILLKIGILRSIEGYFAPSP